MTPARWQQLKTVFQQASELEGAARADFVAAACLGDDALRDEIMRLLRAGDEPEGLLDQPAAAYAPNSVTASTSRQWPGQRIGPYRLIEAIGRGGMGEVWRAARDDGQFSMSVAIKLVRNGHDSAHVLRLFQAERQILAGLEHPNIARLIDGGVTDDGVPYLVMELVEGERIDTYCARHKLSVAQCLELFRTVCGAVQYAHQRLVVHRDLKPGNIMVTADGSVKLLDFGVAKLVEPVSGKVAGDPTITMLRILTPEYASPEQLRGEGITTASDIYSLGVVLFILLTGGSPYGTTGSPHELMRAICDTVTPRPSATLRRMAEDADAKKRARQVAGDADNIVLMAMRKEPDRRYASAAELAEDIRRHLAGLPVSAHEDTLPYRVGKLITRHKFATAATALSLIALVSGSIVTYHQAAALRDEQARSAQRYASVRALAGSLVSEVHDAVQDLPGSIAARRLLVRNAIAYLDALNSEKGADPDLQRELAVAYRKVGDLQGRAGRPNLGDRKNAEVNYSRAIALLENVVERRPADNAARIELAQALEARAWVHLMQAAAPAAAVDSARALHLADAAHAAEPEAAPAKEVLALAHQVVAWTREREGNIDAAVDHSGAAIRIYEELSRDGKPPRLLRYEHGAAQHAASQFLVQSESVERRRAALEALRRAIKLHQTMIDDNPNDILGLTATAQNYIQMGIVSVALKDRTAAIDAYRQGIALHERVAALDPEGMAVRPRRVDAMLRLGVLLRERGDLPAAFALTRDALDLTARWQARSDLALLKVLVAIGQSRLGKLHAVTADGAGLSAARRQQHWREAEKWYATALPALTAQLAQGLLMGQDENEVELATEGLAQVRARLGMRRAAGG